MIALDSNVLIYALNGDVEFARKAQAVLARAAQEQGVASYLIYVELLSVSGGHPTDVSNMQQFLDDLRGVKYLAMDREIAKAAAALRRQYAPGLRLADAVHLATASLSGASEFWTNDLKLKNIVVPKLQIRLLHEAEA